jgi:nicotinate-nucleotide pyrophosphorylase
METVKKFQPTISVDIIDSIQKALAEDIATGDVTTDSIVPQHATMSGRIVAKQVGIVAGLEIAQAVYELLDNRVYFVAKASEGEHVENRQELAHVFGPARAYSPANARRSIFLQTLSGTATVTARFVQALHGTRARLLDTRKTIPGLRRADSESAGTPADHRRFLRTPSPRASHSTPSRALRGCSASEEGCGTRNGNSTCSHQVWGFEDSSVVSLK